MENGEALHALYLHRVLYEGLHLVAVRYGVTEHKAAGGLQLIGGADGENRNPKLLGGERRRNRRVGENRLLLAIVPVSAL